MVAGVATVVDAGLETRSVRDNIEVATVKVHFTCRCVNCIRSR